MSFYRNRKPFSSATMEIVSVDWRSGRQGAWVSPVVITLKDEHGAVQRAFGANEQGEARRCEGPVGTLRVVHFGINSQVTRIEPVA